MSMAFFYPKNTNNSIPNSQISQLIQESLSKALSTYYPFAGILKGDDCVSCTDEGATFVETEITECSLSQILNNPNVSVQNVLYPKGIPWSSSYEDHTLLYAQLNHFKCGGKALGVSLSHKIADGCTMAHFIRHWAAVARQSGDDLRPILNGDSIFPPIKDCDPPPQPEQKGERVISKRFVFDQSNIKKLKAIGSTESGVKNPTRVEVVTALVYKAAMAASMEFSRKFEPSAVTHISNLRSLVNPSMPGTTVENASMFYSIATVDEGDIKFGTLIDQLRKSKEKMVQNCRVVENGNHFSATIKSFQEVATLAGGSQDFDIYAFSSICNFGLHQVDFGWGKPVAMNLAASPQNRFVGLVDDHHGTGIEVAVTLDENFMTIFEKNKELARYTSTWATEY
ncbi:hypothetical protein Leryth_025193 [Lithospermum erythrorhizon]|nr:hypothetical protein Leryth_025193 [Lithospermum erythrorhizon]